VDVPVKYIAPGNLGVAVTVREEITGTITGTTQN